MDGTLDVLWYYLKKHFDDNYIIEEIMRGSVQKFEAPLFLTFKYFFVD